jgi:hypothetical protein
MIVVPRIPATARDKIARGVCFKPSARICSANPGIKRSATAMVASGVTSRGPTPVPPVVTIKSVSFESAVFFRNAAMPSRSSGKTAASTIFQPSSLHRPATAGPELSSYFWLATESLTVRMETRMAASRYRYPSVTSASAFSPSRCPSSINRSASISRPVVVREIVSRVGARLKSISNSPSGQRTA